MVLWALVQPPPTSLELSDEFFHGKVAKSELSLELGELSSIESEVAVEGVTVGLSKGCREPSQR